MYELDRTLTMKAPATVVDTRPVLTLTAPYHAKADLVATVNRQARRGEVRPLTERPGYNGATGQWEWRVVRLRPEAPAWIKPAIIVGAVLIVLAVLAGLLWWVLTSLTAAPLALFLIAAGFALAGIARAGKRQTVNINVSMK